MVETIFSEEDKDGFIPGLELNRRFYEHAVKPILEAGFSQVPYSAALIGWGSEVLGYDTERSTDHHWGPRLHIFLNDIDFKKYEQEITDVMGMQLPFEFHGYPTNFTKGKGVQLLEQTVDRPINHHVYVHTIDQFFAERLGVDPNVELTPKDWLSFSQQRLLELTAGEVYYDGLGTLESMRQKFHYYPDEIWRYLLASQWQKIGQEEAFIGRCGEVGDELGSAVVGSRLIRELMQLCFLIEKQYAPYSKWFGTAFSKLDIGPNLDPILKNVLLATNWKQREEHLGKAYEIVVKAFNSLHLIPPVDSKTSIYHDRPYKVIQAQKIAESIPVHLLDIKQKEHLKLVGSVNQFIDSTDVLMDPGLLSKISILYDE
jgi:hypothetical protein